jgi:hypothetical protein
LEVNAVESELNPVATDEGGRREFEDEMGGVQGLERLCCAPLLA